MTSALLLRNLRHHGRLLLSLLAGFVVLETLICWVGSEMAAGPGFTDFVERFMPQTFRSMLVSQLGVVSFAGMVAFGFQHPAILTASLAYVMVVATIPAAERESGLLDLLLARPVPRRRYLAAVVLTLVTGAILAPVALLGGATVALAFLQVEGELPWHRYLPAAAGLATLLLGIGGLTLLLAAGARRRGPAVARAAGLVIALYVLDFLANLWEPIEPLKWLTPFHYFKPIFATVLSRTPVENPLVLLGVFVAGTALAVRRFERQDL